MGELKELKEYKEYKEFENANLRWCTRRRVNFNGLINFIGQIRTFHRLTFLNS
jgi:hypothetical protein